MQRVPVSTGAAGSTGMQGRLPLGMGVGMLAILLLVGPGCFKLDSDTQALRNAVMKTAGADWDERIEIGVGPLTFALARCVLACVDTDPEVKLGVSALRAAEVGVYERRRSGRALDSSKVLIAGDQVMSRRGWDRVVGIHSGRESVAVYVPRRSTSTHNLTVCVLVVNEEEMVLASARGNAESLMKLVEKKLPRREGGRQLLGSRR